MTPLCPGDAAAFGRHGGHVSTLEVRGPRGGHHLQTQRGTNPGRLASAQRRWLGFPFGLPGVARSLGAAVPTAVQPAALLRPTAGATAAAAAGRAAAEQSGAQCHGALLREGTATAALSEAELVKFESCFFG